tara:strand:+ start:714 stop:1250 length:537 start_codon:yes stop_codon:yes gene_type:complete
MITIDNICENDIVEVLVSDEGLEEYMYGVVTYNTGTFIEVRYLSHVSKIYKGAEVYELEETKNLIEVDSISTHYHNAETLEDMGYMNVKENLYVKTEDIDNDFSSNCGIIDLSDDEYEDDDNDSFIASDHEDELFDPPSDHKEVDAAWNAWEPTSVGGKYFKNVVNRIDEIVQNYVRN